MLGKLLKYDIKKIDKFLLIFYTLALIFSLLTRIFLNISTSFVLGIVGQICSAFTIAMIASILINNIMRLWIKFKNTLYDDESYLTHTLPVDRKTIYLSKIIISIITMLVSMIVIALTLFIAYYSKENIKWIKDILIPLANIYNQSILGIITLFLIVFFTEMINILQVGYTGIILGHKMSNNKVGYSVAFGFIIYLISQVLTLLTAFIFALLNKDLMNLFITDTKTVLSIEMIKNLGYICITIYLIIFVITSIINIKLLKNGVNIE